jgi:uncharacterized membrane protein
VDDPRLPRLLYFFLFLVCLLLLVYYYPQMPQRMAAHFAANGHVNGWQSRESFFLLSLLINAISAVITFFAPWQIASKPSARINLPNREYWLAPERRDATMRYIASTMAWFGCGVLFVLISGTFLALRANLAPDQRFNSEAMLVVMGAFLLSLMSLILRLIRHFQNVTPQS